MTLFLHHVFYGESFKLAIFTFQLLAPLINKNAGIPALKCPNLGVWLRARNSAQVLSFLFSVWILDRSSPSSWLAQHCSVMLLLLSGFPPPVLSFLCRTLLIFKGPFHSPYGMNLPRVPTFTFSLFPPLHRCPLNILLASLPCSSNLCV